MFDEDISDNIHQHDDNENDPRNWNFAVFPTGSLCLLDLFLCDGAVLRKFPLYGEILLLDIRGGLHRLDEVVDPSGAADILSGQTFTSWDNLEFRLEVSVSYRDAPESKLSDYWESLDISAEDPDRHSADSGSGCWSSSRWWWPGRWLSCPPACLHWWGWRDWSRCLRLSLRSTGH